MHYKEAGGGGREGIKEKLITGRQAAKTDMVIF